MATKIFIDKQWYEMGNALGDAIKAAEQHLAKPTPTTADAGCAG